MWCHAANCRMPCVSSTDVRWMRVIISVVTLVFLPDKQPAVRPVGHTGRLKSAHVLSNAHAVVLSSTLQGKAPRGSTSSPTTIAQTSSAACPPSTMHAVHDRQGIARHSNRARRESHPTHPLAARREACASPAQSRRRASINRTAPGGHSANHAALQCAHRPRGRRSRGQNHGRRGRRGRCASRRPSQRGYSSRCRRRRRTSSAP